jgi:homoserine dehydrogenase
LIQSKALHYAYGCALPFEVGRPNEAAGTRVGHTHDEWAAPARPSRPLGLALCGCGVVGRGVYETVKRYAQAFELRHVVVRDVGRYPGIEGLTADPSALLDEAVDVVIVCITGTALAYPLIAAVLNAGKFVITTNRAAVAANGMSLAGFARGEGRRLWYSAAVGGALPAIETLGRIESPVREIRGILNGTCGVVSDAWAEGRDSADKLALLIEAAFGQWIDPQQIVTTGIDTIAGDPAGYRLIARAARTKQGRLTANVAPDIPPPGSFLGKAQGAENRLEIELATGELIRLRGQGAGRWPTAVSVLGDLHEVARLVEAAD